MSTTAPNELPSLAGEGTGRRVWVILALLIVVSTALKLAFVGPAEELPLFGDQKHYVFGARSLVETGEIRYEKVRWDDSHYSPAYPHGLAAVLRMAGDDGFLAAARSIQVGLSALSVLLVFLIARRLFSLSIALWSAAVYGLHPTPMAFSHYLLTETLYTALLLGIVTVLLSGRTTPGFGRALAAGLIGGLAALTKSQFVALVPLACLWFIAAAPATRRLRAVGTAAAFAMGAALVIAPWSSHKTAEYERFLLIDTNAGNVLYKNWNVLRPENHDVGMFRQWNEDRLAYRGDPPMRQRLRLENPAENNAAEVRAAIDFTLEHPGIFASHTVLRAQDFFNPSSFLVREIREGHYDWLPRWLRETLVWLVLVPTAAILLLGVLGILTRIPSREALLPLALMAGSALLCVLIVATSRYRFPLMPLLLPFAVDGAARLPAILRERPRGLWLAAPLLAFIVVAWIRLVPLSL